MRTFLGGCLAVLALTSGAQAAELIVLSAGAVKPRESRQLEVSHFRESGE